MQTNTAEKTNGTVPAVQQPRAPLVTGNKIGAIVPADIDQAWRIAGIISNADMAPKSYNRDQNRIMVGILHGMEVGLTPMAALQSIAVINGMPSIWGDGAMALVEASGLLEDKSETIDGTGMAMRARCVLKRKGRSTPIAGEFSMEEAKAAGLLGKAGPWQGYPRRMLQMRARSYALRDGFADVLKGLGIAEERQDMEHQAPENAKDVTPPRPQRADFAAPEDSQPAEPLPAVTEGDEREADRMMERAQRGEDPAGEDEPADEQPQPEPQPDPWLISAQAFKSADEFAHELARQLRDVCVTEEDRAACMKANFARYSDLAKPKRGEIDKLVAGLKAKSEG